jgi:hypothetical protein
MNNKGPKYRRLDLHNNVAAERALIILVRLGSVLIRHVRVTPASLYSAIMVSIAKNNNNTRARELLHRYFMRREIMFHTN